MNIFVTVGTELPFDRLVRTVDDWARQTGRMDVFAQIGEASYLPSHIGYSRFLEPPEFSRRFAEADVIVAHAGMGTILTALSFAKPLLVMPRRAALGEHRSEHQVATARHMLEMEKVAVAFDEAELATKLGELDELKAGDRIAAFAGQDLIDTVRGFIAAADADAPRRAPLRFLRPLRRRGPRGTPLGNSAGMEGVR